jgi:hypothetical protein
MSAPRYLRPAILQVVANELWVVDVVQPVAAVVDPTSGSLLRVVSWPALPPAAEHRWQGEWLALSDGEALWVQAGSGAAARVLPDGEVVVATVHTTTDTQPFRLAAAGPRGAWLAPDPPPQHITRAADAPPPDHGWSRVLLAAPDGSVRVVVVEHPVLDVVGTGSGTALAVDTGHGARRDLGAGHWSWEPETAWLLVPDDEPVPERIAADTAPRMDPPTVPCSAIAGSGLFLWHPDTLDDPEGRHEAPIEPAGGLVWRAGWNARSGSFVRRSIATGEDPASGEVRHRVELGPGAVRSLAGTPDSLFVAAGRPDPAHGLHPSETAPGAVLAVDPADGRVRELLAADSVDVSAHLRPPGDPPADADSYVRYWARYWGDVDGRVAPVTGRMRNGRVEVTGAWPETALEITFDWAPLPGWRLRRRLPLFDELGRPTPPEYSDVHLGEDLATGKIPPVPPGAAGGVLDL